MSFASQVKEEVARLEINDDGKRAELSAILKLLSTLNISSRGMSLRIRSKNSVIIKMISQHIQDLYGYKPEIEVIKETKLNRNNIYAVVIRESVLDILEDLDLWHDGGIREHPRMKFLKNDNMVRSFITGSFLATGSINSPSTTYYHREISCTTEDYADFLVRLLARYSINRKTTLRRDRYVVYLKASEQISDFLRLIGATDAIFEFEDVRIQRDFVNSLSRWNNCEIANDAKSLEAAQKQYEAVRYLVESGNLIKLASKDQEIAMVRYENPEASFVELSRIYEGKTGQALSKSGIRHRFIKIIDLADKYRSRKED